MELNRQQALDLLKTYNKEPFHLRHALTVEAVMRWFAQELGYGEQADFWATVFLAQPLQMLGYGLFTPASVYFVNESVPQADRVRGQTVMMVASNGMGGMLGSYISGLALDAGASLPMGGANLMLLCCIALGCAATALAAVALALRKKSKRGNL